MNATTKVNSRDIQDQMTCKLCNGYFIDATTIIECLHSFCKSCIVKHLEKSEYCPVCDVQLHTSKPLSSIRSDQMLQEIVYKLVPGLFQNEMQRRRKFYSANCDSKPVSQVDSGHVYSESYITSDDIIHLSLEHYTDNDEFRESTKRFFKCPAAVSISILKKLIQGKYDLCNEAHIEVMYGQRVLPDDFLLMDIAYKYSWTQNGKPLQLSYRIKGPSSVFKPVIISNAIEELITAETTGRDNKKNVVRIENKGKIPVVKKRQSRATGTNTSPFINTNGIIAIATRQILVTNGIMNGQPTSSTTTKKGGQTPLASTTNSDTAITTTPRSRKKKKAALVETNNQSDLINGLPNPHITPKLKSKLKSIRHNKDGTKMDGKEKEVQLRISENGVISARNVASGEEKIILGANNNMIGPPTSLSSTTISPGTAVLAASPIINIHIPTSSNGIVNNHVMTPGPRLVNNSLLNKCSITNPNLVSTILPKTKQQQSNVIEGKLGKQKNKSPNKPLSLKRLQNVQGTTTESGSNSERFGITPTATIPKNNPLLSVKKKDGNNIGVVKTSYKRKLINSSTNVNGSLDNNVNNKSSSSSKGGGGGTNNMETLKAVTKRLKEELETKGMNYFSAEITPLDGTPNLKNSITEGQHFPSGAVCNVIQNPNSNIHMGNLNKRLHQTSTIINGDVNYIPTTPTKKSFLPSPNTKIFPKTSSTNNSPSSNERQKNQSPSVSPKKPPKFFKSRYSIAEVNTATTTTIGSPSIDNFLLVDSTAGTMGVGGTNTSNSYCMSVANGSSSSKKVKLNHNIAISSNEQNNLMSTSTTTTVMSMASLPTPTVSIMPSSVMTNTTTAGQPGPFRLPLHMSMNFPNGMPMNLVPFVTSSYCSMPFLNNLKNINIPSIPFGNPYMDFAQLQSLSQSLNSNGNVNVSTISTNSNNNVNSSLDLSVSKINHDGNGAPTIIVPHSIQSSTQLQNLHPQPHQAVLDSTNSNGNTVVNARVDPKMITSNDQQQYIQLSTALMGSLSNNNSNNIVDTTNSKSFHNSNHTLNQMDSKTNSLHAKGKSASGNSNGTPLSKTKLNEFEVPSITNNLVTAQNMMKGMHNLGLGVNFNSTTKNPRKSASPAKRGSNNNNPTKFSTPEKAGKSKVVVTITTAAAATVGAEKTHTTTATTTTTTTPATTTTQGSLPQENEKVSNDFIENPESSTSDSNPKNSSINGDSVNVPVDMGDCDKVTNPCNLENGHDGDVCNDEPLASLNPPTTTNGIEIKDDDSSGSDEFAMQIDEGCPLSVDEDVHNVNSEESTNVVHNNNNVTKDSPPANKIVSQIDSSSTTTTTTSA